MKEEIKEILEYVLSITYGNENAIKGVDKVLDYITNLQEENERLKQPQIFIDTMDMEERYGQELYEDYLKEQLKDYKQRNEKAIEYLKECKELEFSDLDLLNILKGGNDE